MKDSVGFVPLPEAGFDGRGKFVEAVEVEVVRGQPPGRLPNPFDGRGLWAVGRQEQQFDILAVPIQVRLEGLGVVVSGVVRHDNHPSVPGTAAEQRLEEVEEGLGAISPAVWRCASPPRPRSRASSWRRVVVVDAVEILVQQQFM